MSRTAILVILVALLPGTQAPPAFGGERAARLGWSVREPTRFLVSGVLQREGSSDVIKPIHSIITAEDSQAAISFLARTAKQQYPGYRLLATLASPVPAIGTCENDI